MSVITAQNIYDALKNVYDPDLRRDLVTLNMIKNLEIKGSDVSFDVELTTPACPLKDKIKDDCINALKKDVAGIGNISVNMTASIKAHRDAAREAIMPGVKNTIAVASGKGGVGKSTVAVNIAVALAQQGARVGLLDADIYGPSIPLMLGINDKPQIFQDAQTQKMLPLEKYGIKIMSIGFMIDENMPVIWRGPMASGALKQFMSDVHWGELDYLVFDMPPGTGDIQLTLVQTIPLSGAVIVTTPQDVSLIDARKGLKMFSRVNVPLLGIVENMSYFVAPDTGIKYDIFGTGGGNKLAEENGLPFLGGIPIDPRIRIGGDKGTPVIYDAPGSEHAGAIVSISQNMAAQLSKVNEERAGRKVNIILDEN